MLKNSFLLLIFLPFFVLADEKAKPGEGWKTWESFKKNLIGDDHEKTKLFMSEHLKGKLHKAIHFKNLSKKFKKFEVKFIKEIEFKDNRLVHIELKDEKGTIHVVLHKGKWLVNEMVQGHAETLENVQKARLKIQIQSTRAIVMSQLAQIGKYIFERYQDEGERTIPNWKELDIPENLMNYKDPETGKAEKVIIVEGVEFTGKSDLAMASTLKPIGGQHPILWEDGHVTSVKAEKFKALAIKSGLIKEDLSKIKLSIQEVSEISSLIKKLGSGKFKDRKAAKESLLSKGIRILNFLEENQNQEDFETQVSVKEIISELKKQIPLVRRVKTKK